MSHDIEQHTPSPSPTRRTVLTGAAWSVPVIAAASLAPFATASGTLALAFNQASYSGTACGTLTIVVTATTNAVATAGASVTIALSNGYTFSGGGTTYSGVTDSAGQVVGIPAINVPAAGGTTTFTAVSGAATANATATATASLGSAFLLDAYGNVSAKPNVPTGSKPIGYLYYLTAGGNLVDSDGNVIATNVAEVGTPVSYGTGGIFFVPFTKQDGSAFLIDANGNVTARTGVPTGSKPIGYLYYLTTGGNLVDADGNVIATNVAEVGTPVGYGAGGIFYVPFTKKDGSAFMLDAYGTVTAKTNVPSGSKPIGYRYYLTAGGNLIDADGDVVNVVATNVGEVGTPVSYGSHNVFFFPFLKKDGSAFLLDANGTVTAETNVPTGSKPIGYYYYLTQGGNLIDAAGNVIATNVAEAGTPVGYGSGAVFFFPFTKKAASC